MKNDVIQPSLSGMPIMEIWNPKFYSTTSSHSWEAPTSSHQRDEAVIQANSQRVRVQPARIQTKADAVSVRWSSGGCDSILPTQRTRMQTWWPPLNLIQRLRVSSSWPEIDCTQGPEGNRVMWAKSFKVELMWVVRSIPDLCSWSGVAHSILPNPSHTHKHTQPLTFFSKFSPV